MTLRKGAELDIVLAWGVIPDRRSSGGIGLDAGRMPVRRRHLLNRVRMEEVI